MRLIHYSKKPLVRVRSMKHTDYGCGAYKTPGLWVSVEGADDWLAWCKAESWSVDAMACATEVILAGDANVHHISGAASIDAFTAEFKVKNRPDWDRSIDWPAIRKRWRGLIIAPYCWERRLSPHTSWYYGWDCASGVIWGAKAVKELRAIDLPDLSDKSEAA